MKNTKSFTIIGLIVGFIVIAITSLAAFEFFRYCRHFIVDSELRLAATNFARETIEELDWDAGIENTTGWPTDKDLPDTGFGRRLQNEYDGERLYNVEDAATGDYKIIKVKVSWEY